MSEPDDYLVPPCSAPIRLLYQDEALLVVEKPAGLLSVPGRHPANRDSLITRLQEDFPQALIVHRLDLETSGLLVIALDKQVHRELSRQFAERRVEKSYQAVVAGQPPTQGSIDLPLICDWPNRPRQKVDHQQGKPSLTHYQRLAYDPATDSARVLLQPVTGRSHQLRVHLAETGHPILGCRFYAPSEIREASERLLLHAAELAFFHPRSGEKLTITSAIPF